MAGRPDEVQAGVHPQVDLVLSLGLLFLTHVCLMLIVNEVYDRCPRVAVVDVVAKSRRVNDRELCFELLLFELSLNDLHLGQLVKLLVVTAVVVLGWG